MESESDRYKQRKDNPAAVKRATLKHLPEAFAGNFIPFDMMLLISLTFRLVNVWLYPTLWFSVDTL